MADENDENPTITFNPELNLAIIRQGNIEVPISFADYHKVERIVQGIPSVGDAIVNFSNRLVFHATAIYILTRYEALQQQAVEDAIKRIVDEGNEQFKNAQEQTRRISKA